MKTKNFILVFLYSIVFILLFTPDHWGQDPCPSYSDVLDKGWAPSIGYPHIPQRANRDEFGVVEFEPFILKINDYPPVKSFQITPNSGCGGEYFYFSFDTDGDNLPINHWVVQNVPNPVKTYMIDQNGNYFSGYSMVVTPPTSSQIGNGPPDFVMKYDGTMHDVAWDIN